MVEALKRRVVSRTHRRQPGDQETLVVIRYRDRDQQEVVQVDYYLSNATPATPLWEFARVAKASMASKSVFGEEKRSRFGGL